MFFLTVPNLFLKFNRLCLPVRNFKAVNEAVLLYKPGSIERNELEKTLQKTMSGAPYDVPIVVGNAQLTSKAKKKQVLPFEHNKVLANFCYADEGQLGQAIESCLAARKTWSRTPFDRRVEIFLKAADLISTEYRSALVAATMLGQAKTIYQAEIDAVAELADFLRFNVQFALDALKFKPISTPDADNSVVYRPNEGFWAAIPPFNFTAIAGNLASAPVLMGNVTLWKPSDTAVYSNYLVYQIFRQAGLPEGVINFVPADGPTFGKVITEHPQLAGINFTGSTATYRTLLKMVGNNIARYNAYPRTIGECGGKNYHLLHPSAKVEEAALATVRSAFEYSGQKCSACSRLYVPVSLWPACKAALLRHLGQTRIGSPLAGDTFTSAVIDATAFKKISGYIDYARQSPNMEIIAGGKVNDSKGYFIEPTIVLTKDPLDKIMKDDIFGPFLGVYVFEDKDIDSIIDLVDTTSKYALTGAIFAQDTNFIRQASDRLIDSTGNFYINVQSTGSVVGQQPFGGARLSGTNDKAGGPHYVLRFASPLSIKTARLPVVSWKQAHMD